MTAKERSACMATPRITLLSAEDIQAIHDTSLKILRDVGVLVRSTKVLEYLAVAGARVDRASGIARIDERTVLEAIETTTKQYAIYGRDGRHVARYGYGDQNLISSPGQYAWFDHRTGERRTPLLQDATAAATVADALPNVTVVGAMSVPGDVPPEVRDVVVTAELVKTTTKPTWCWPVSCRSSQYVLEIYKALAGGKNALREKPMVEAFLEPISPLQLAPPSLDNVFEYIDHGQPVCVGPMASVCGTGPATLAGTLAQENAEILAGIVTVQAIGPGTPMMYGGIPHILDPRKAAFVFSSPEQALMAVAMTEIGKAYGMPVYINVNLSDAKTLDAQAGMEKLGTLIPGMLAGADLFGHAGIVGQDHGGSLLWLVVDNEAAGFAKRVLRGFTIDADTLADSVVADVGPAGNYLMHEHTLRHYQKELWFPSTIWTRETFDAWQAGGQRTVTDRARRQVDTILTEHRPEPMDPDLSNEIDRIVAAARRELTPA
jgi:trimethylamine--corrinoid protein Co-methyltransferase